MESPFHTYKGPLIFQPLMPEGWEGRLLLAAQPYSYNSDTGTIVMQELKTRNYLLRHFSFLLTQSWELFHKTDDRLQSLLSLKGDFDLKLNEHHKINIRQGQFFLFRPKKNTASFSIPAEKVCHILTASYAPGFYNDWLPLFPKLFPLKSKTFSSIFLTDTPYPARSNVFDAVRALFYENYLPYLQPYFNELKVREKLFSFLAQSSEVPLFKLSERELQKAEAAHQIITANISKHYTNEELATLVNMSESELIRVFKLRYGIGMFQLLQKLRFDRAQELLRQGHNIKSVAHLVGYARTTTFITEFRKYFDYTPRYYQKKFGR